MYILVILAAQNGDEGWGINYSHPPPAYVTVIVCSKLPYGSLRCSLLWPGNGPASRKEP